MTSVRVRRPSTCRPGASADPALPGTGVITLPGTGVITRRIAAAIAAAALAVGGCRTEARSRPAAAPTTLWGVSESGMEFGHGMKAGTNYVVPDPGYYLARGITLIRLPVQIDRLLPVHGAPLDPQLVAEIDGIIGKDRQAGAVTVIDPHGYGFINEDGKPRDILQDAQARADYVDLMGKLGASFHGDGVAIGLMNEPHTGADEAYAPIWNDAIAAMRRAGYHGVVLVPHAHWSAAHDISPDTPFGGRIVDPEHRWVLELHSYLDPDGTGTYRKPVASATIGAERLAGAIAWSRKTGVRIFLGETGGPPDPAGIAAFSGLLETVQAAPDVFWGIAIWGAGPWWKPNYPMRLDPIGDAPRPQFRALEAILTPETLFLAGEPDQPDQPVGISVDGRAVPGPIIVSAVRTAAPQEIPLRLPLAPGSHQVRIVPGDGRPLYLLGADWKGPSNGKGAFGEVPAEGRVIRITIPG